MEMEPMTHVRTIELPAIVIDAQVAETNRRWNDWLAEQNKASVQDAIHTVLDEIQVELSNLINVHAGDNPIQKTVRDALGIALCAVHRVGIRHGILPDGGAGANG